MSHKVADKLKKADNIPPLPEVVHEILSITSKEDFSIKDLKKAIEKDPLLVAKILKVANSFMYNPYGREITSIDRAIMQLGTKNLVPIVVGLSIAGMSDLAGKRFDKEVFWKHSYTCGHVAKRLAKRFKLPEAEAFTAGILHDIGKLILYILFPEDYEKALKLSEERNLPSTEAERLVFDMDHTEAGRLVLQHWKLPKLIIDVVEHHHEPSKAKHKELAALVNISNILTRITGMYYNRDTLGVVLTDSEGWRILTKEATEEELEELVFSVFDDAEDAAQFAEIAWSR